MACAYTSMEYYRSIPEANNPVELIDNVLHEPGAPYYVHQKVVLDIAFNIRLRKKGKLKKGTLVTAPFDVYLDEVANAVQPDIIFILPDNPGVLKGQFHGVPDFIVEVLSQSDRKHDQKVKLELYERFRVKEYWIVDPTTQMVHGYSLVRRRFKALSPQKGKINSRLLDLVITF